jgi:hypothetical protein
MTHELREGIRTCHERLWRRFIHPRFGLIYDYVAPCEDDGQAFWWLPTPEEITRRYPNPQGWATGMEDSSINGGVYLATMVTAYHITGQDEYRDRARRLYQGLIRTATSSPERGFIARSLSYDGAHWYPASSVDQYTWWMHGMWTYARSGIATDRQIETIRGVAHDVCTRLERDDWEIRQEGGSPAYYCDIGAFTPDRSTRLLEVLRIAHDLTSEEHWLDLYYDKVHEDYDRRLDSVQDMLAYTPIPYAVLQTAASLVPLIALESDQDIKARYVLALNACARGMWYAVPACYRYDSVRIAAADWSPDWRQRYPPEGFHKGELRFMPPGWAFEDQVVRRPCEAMMVIAYATDTDPAMEHHSVRDQLLNVMRWALTTYDYERLHSYALIYAEGLYWLALDKHLIALEPPMCS